MDEAVCSLSIEKCDIVEACLSQCGISTQAESQGLTSALPVPVVIVIAGCLLCFSATFSGLTLGLMSLDTTGLKILQEAGTGKQKQYADTIMPIREKGNQLLCTLLLGNTLVNSALAIVLTDLTEGVPGLVVSTVLILLFGEIVPQAICTRHGLMIGARTAWMTNIFMWLFYIICRPLSKLLDLVLGQQIGVTYSKEELQKLVEMVQQHQNEQNGDSHGGQNTGQADDNTLDMVQGALQYADKKVSEVTTPIDRVFMIDESIRLTFKNILLIHKAGYTRIPVYRERRDNIVAILLVKDLIVLDPDDEIPIKSLLTAVPRDIQYIYEGESLRLALKKFQVSRKHMLIVTDRRMGLNEKYNVTGIITLENVLEEVTQINIVDETDNYEDGPQQQRLERKNDRAMERYEYLAMYSHVYKKSHLGQFELKNVVTFLLATVDAFSVFREYPGILKQLIHDCELKQVGDLNIENVEEKGETLCSIGCQTNEFVLVLQGKVVIRDLSQQETFEVELGPLQYINQRVLTQLDQQYVPDYTAQAIYPFRVLVVSRDKYLAALQKVQMAGAGYQIPTQKPSSPDRGPAVVHDAITIPVPVLTYDSLMQASDAAASSTQSSDNSTPQHADSLALPAPSSIKVPNASTSLASANSVDPRQQEGAEGQEALGQQPNSASYRESTYSAAPSVDGDEMDSFLYSLKQKTSNEARGIGSGSPPGIRREGVGDSECQNSVFVDVEGGHEGDGDDDDDKDVQRRRLLQHVQGDDQV